MKLTSIQFLVVGVFVLMLPFCTTAQEEVLSKSEAIALTLENNYNIAVAGNTVEIAENNADLLNSNYLPSIFGLAGANYSVQDQQTDRDDGQSFELNDARSESYNASLNLEVDT